jgi:hypothetical protein
MSGLLAKEQKQRALELMREYLAAPRNPDGRKLQEVQAERDQKRLNLIQTVLGPLLLRYLNGQVPLAKFKSEIDSINKRHEYWGFKGIKGQMFFNMIVNVADNEAELDQELKAAITLPPSEEIASSRIKTFSSYVKRLGEQFVEAGGSLHGRPKVGSIPFFLSYFWQIQNPKTWPVFYTNSVQVVTSINLWQPADDIAVDYLSFKHLEEELAELFSKDSGIPFGLYEVEHVFWFKGGNPFGGDRPIRDPEGEPHVQTKQETFERLPDAYIPPIIQILPRLALNDESLVGLLT